MYLPVYMYICKQTINQSLHSQCHCNGIDLVSR